MEHSLTVNGYNGHPGQIQYKGYTHPGPQMKSLCTYSLKQPPHYKVLLYLTPTIQHIGRLSQEVHNILFTKHLHKVLTSVVDLQ